MRAAQPFDAEAEEAWEDFIRHRNRRARQVRQDLRRYLGLILVSVLVLTWGWHNTRNADRMVDSLSQQSHQSR